MDLFSHGLWTAALGRGVNDFVLKPKSKKPLKLKRLIWWGIFPDVFSFAIPFIYIIPGLLLGNLKSSDLPSPENMEPMTSGSVGWLFRLASSLYNISHSLIIFSVVFGIVFLILRRPAWEMGGPPARRRGSPIPWEMGGWLFHIIIDIPTHSYKFFATPFLWPISGVKFNGFSWGTPWFLIADYSAIFLVYLFLAIKEKRLRK